MKRSQMEIMGLAIVIVLITLGMLFVVRFVIIEENSNPRTEYTESQLAANLLNAMLQMTATDCNNKQIKTLFRDCALANQIRCDGGEDSCSYLDSTVGEILSETLVHWNRKFYFNATNTDENFPGGINFGERCTGDIERKFYPIQAQAKTVMISLEICGIEKE